VAVVSGGGSRGTGIGNGRAAAILLARAGARVAVWDADRAAADATAQAITAEGGTATAYRVDVTDDVQVAHAVTTVVAELGPPSVLVNNVGVSGPMGTAETLDLDEWDRGLRINVTSMMLTVRHVVPHMRRAGAGSIVNISSIFGLTGGHHALLYPTSKAAVIGLTRAMAAHYGPDGVRVNCVAPGPVWTPMVESQGLSDAVRAERRRQGALPTEGTGWDVGDAVVYLVGPMSRWVTGVVLPVDAGLTSGPMRPIHGR
jgi:NAD(P)-dependent dehydrogenase (short-subunit alcohol dehydrogenase family)